MSVRDEAVRALLRRSAVVVDPDATLRAVAELLADESIGAVVVRGTGALGSSGSGVGA